MITIDPVSIARDPSGPAVSPTAGTTAAPPPSAPASTNPEDFLLRAWCHVLLCLLEQKERLQTLQQALTTGYLPFPLDQGIRRVVLSHLHRGVSPTRQPYVLRALIDLPRDDEMPLQLGSVRFRAAHQAIHVRISPVMPGRVQATGIFRDLATLHTEIVDSLHKYALQLASISDEKIFCEAVDYIAVDPLQAKIVQHFAAQTLTVLHSSDGVSCEEKLALAAFAKEKHLWK